MARKARRAPGAAAPAASPPAYELAAAVVRRAIAQAVRMIWEANHRDDAEPGDPKVGGHPAASTSAAHILGALHLFVREPQDMIAGKPHASPMDHAYSHLLGLLRDGDGWMDEASSAAAMSRLRDFPRDGAPVFQSYHAPGDPDSAGFLPTGSVGIPAVAAVYLALAHRFARARGFDVPGDAHFWAVIGDGESREGSLMECMPDAAERELGSVTWIVDYNRQNLDGERANNASGLRGTDADRLRRTAEANGWSVIEVRDGPRRCELFATEGGEDLRGSFEALTDLDLQRLLLAESAPALRASWSALDPGVDEALAAVGDDALLEAVGDFGGHHLPRLVEALRASKEDPRRPCLVIAHTLKGFGLSLAARSGNHSALPDLEEVDRLSEDAGLPTTAPFARFGEDSPEAEFLGRRGETLRSGIDGLEDEARLRSRAAAALAPEAWPARVGVPGLANVPLAPTQWTWGQVLARLVRIGSDAAPDELPEEERPWAGVARLVLTMAPDVGTSTNINAAMDGRTYGPPPVGDGIEERGRPRLLPTEGAEARHLRFDIAEATAMCALGAFGKMGELRGVPLMPCMTVYDFFIKRALDQLFYDLYWGASFLLVGTPSGVTLSPEGAQHSWKSDLQLPNLITWEPCFGVEVDWIVAETLRRHLEGDHAGRSGVLLRTVTRGVPQRELIARSRRQLRFKAHREATLGVDEHDPGVAETTVAALPDDEILAAVRRECLAGGYRLVCWRGYQGYAPSENVVTITVMGALVTEALSACDRLLEHGVYADVVVVTSPDLLVGTLARSTGYEHLRALVSDAAPIVAVVDGEPGLLDNMGSVLGRRQDTLGVRRFSKSGTPRDVYRHHGLDADTIAEACTRIMTP